MAKPKLALIPATQGSKLYSVLPADGVGDFNFSRNSAATRINKDGLIETVAVGKSRLNYPLIDGVVNGCPSHLLEPQRTNLITYSEDFSNTAWSKTNTSITSDAVISPDGTLNADSIVGNGASGLHYVLNSVTVLSGQDYTFSIFAKVGTNNFFQLNMGGAQFGSSNYCNFNLSNGTIGSFGNTTSNRFIEKLGDGWYRVGFTSTTFSGGSANFFPMLITSATSSFLETNTLDTSVQIYGAMLEQDSYPTSYIPTSGSAVTRVAETANGAGDASTFNDSEGVLMAEISAFSDDSSFKLFGINSGGTGNDIVILGYSNVANTLYVNTKIGSTSVISDTGQSIDQKSFNKISVKYKSGSNSIYVNGFKLASNTNTFTPTGTQLNELQFSYYTNTLNFYGSAKQIQYFDSALNDSDLEKITSWTSFTDLANGQTYSIK